MAFPQEAAETTALASQPKAFSVPPAPELSGLNTRVGGGVPGVPEDFAASRKNLKSSQDVSGEQARILQRQTQLEQDIGTAHQAEKQYLAGAKADIATQEREAAQRIEADLDATRAKFPYKEFHPTKDNVQDLATMFGVIGLVASAMGGAGKQSGMLALNSMTGMMKGWQQGRADLWKKEKEEFDKNMQRTKAILEDAYKDADRAYKSLAYNRQEAEALAGQSAAKLGGQVGKQILEKQGVENYYKYLTGVKNDLQHAEDLASKERQHKEQMAQRASQHKQDMAQKERLAKVKAESKGQGSAANTRYAFNVAESFGQAAQDLLNVTKMPAGTVMGNFAELGGKSGDSLKAGLTAAFGRAVTKQDERMFSQIVAGLDQNMSRALGGGYASSSAKHMIDAYKQQLPREGDSPATTALFLARFKQELQILGDVFEAHPGATDRMTGKVNKYLGELNKAIPFTVEDVFAASGGGKATISQNFQTLAREPSRGDLPYDNGSGAAPPAAAAAPTAKLNGRTIVVRGGKWVYQDTGEEAK